MQQPQSSRDRYADAKGLALPAELNNPSAPWKEVNAKDAPAPRPEWTRYIDSRLKQYACR